MREADGLAMSSRNAYLKPDERKIAGKLNVILKGIAARMRSAETISSAESAGNAALLEAGFNSVDYVAIRDAETLNIVESLSGPARILAAAKIGATRLIDNFAV
jgi:pantoate--beta-alanine ligase